MTECVERKDHHKETPAQPGLRSACLAGSCSICAAANSPAWLAVALLVRTRTGPTGGGNMPKVQPPELKGFMDKKLSSERPFPAPPPHRPPYDP